MKRFLVLLALLLLPSLTKAASPSFGQVMWTNDTSIVLLSPERSTNRIQLTTNLVTFGGVSSSFPAMWRVGTTVNFRLADNSAFATVAGGLINSRSAGMILDTEDSATPFAYSFLFRKKGNTGNTNSAIANGAELGNLRWQGWDGATYTTAAGWLVKSEQAWVAATSLGTRMELNLTPSNSATVVEAARFVLPNATNAMLTFNGSSDSQPALRRFGRQLQIRSADNSGYADLTASNFVFVGPGWVWNQLELTNDTPASNPTLRLWGGGGANGYSDIVHGGGGSGATNRISISFGSNTVAVGQAIVFHSTVINGGINNIVLTNASFSASGSLIWTNVSGLIENGPSYTFVGLRAGKVTGVGSTYWDSANVGNGSIGFGSNNLAGGYMSSVLGGAMNLLTNSPYSVISGGESNIMGTDGAGHNFMGGGYTNTLTGGSSNCVIAGGRGNLIDTAVRNGTIGGGETNRIKNIHSTIAGGHGNQTGGDSSTVGGGFGNVAGNTTGSDYVFVGGGDHNVVNPDYGTIAGGANNFVENNATWGFIGGGSLNDVNGEIANCPGGSANIINFNSHNSFILGGTSNNTASSVSAVGVIGSFGTNSTPASILLSPRGPHGSNTLHVTAQGTTNVGPLFVKVGAAAQYARVPGNLTNAATSIVNAGAAATNLLTYMILAHTLTNNGDRVTFRASGRFAGNANNKTIQVFWGSETVFDSTAQAANGGAWVVDGQIIRTGSTAQSVNASFIGNGITLFTLASSGDLAQTNGINTLLRVVSVATADGDITNRTLTVDYHPASL